jgi:hypothetical protein
MFYLSHLTSLVTKKACQSKFPRQDVDQTHDANLGCCRAVVPLPFDFYRYKKGVPIEISSPRCRPNTWCKPRLLYGCCASPIWLLSLQKRRANRNFLAKMSAKHMMQTSVVVGLLYLSHLPFIVPKKRRLNRLFWPRCRPNINFLLPGLTWISFPGNKPLYVWLVHICFTYHDHSSFLHIDWKKMLRGTHN